MTASCPTLWVLQEPLRTSYCVARMARYCVDVSSGVLEDRAKRNETNPIANARTIGMTSVEFATIIKLISRCYPDSQYRPESVGLQSRVRVISKRLSVGDFSIQSLVHNEREFQLKIRLILRGKIPAAKTIRACACVNLDTCA